MKRALISVSDKRGLAPFARGLAEAGLEIVASGGTARTLREAGVEVRDVADVTGHPEILDGRVKTLHPRIHGGVLARSADVASGALAAHDVEPFDLVVVNLYPFREAAAREGASEQRVLEFVDIGGPALLRAAAKTHERVTVVVDPEAYDDVLVAIADGGPRAAMRRRLARAAFAHVAAYDAAIVAWFDAAETRDVDASEGAASNVDAALPPTLHLALERAEVLRYGENPHQLAARYRTIGRPGAWDAATRHKGRAPSYLNLLDGEAAWRLAYAFDAPAAVVVKHADPCGVAERDALADAYAAALDADPVSAFGGVVAFNREVDHATAERILAGPKADVLVAPSYAPDALEHLASKRKAMRVLEVPPPGPRPLEVRSLDGGLLVQTPDPVDEDLAAGTVATSRAPTDAEWRDLRFAWRVVAATGSNAIVLARDGVALGIGAGQQNRVDAARLAVRKADGRAEGGAVASDAFFPFPDGLEAALASGATAVVQPGGSVNDDAVVAAAEARGVAMVLTGVRHFRH
ncbi:MAG: bifunctional phosphoribosylaminoimidazolecarboxamide formyltransferase/IMP cyclohydrolase [Trueperaceae bacterium]|nr:bifunctional phosphoribosylaminoimidazolecarboxamide formyltransferase/IMP cyclohydrolase [Trueperaceae bacterium]